MWIAFVCNQFVIIDFVGGSKKWRHLLYTIGWCALVVCRGWLVMVFYLSYQEGAYGSACLHANATISCKAVLHSIFGLADCSSSKLTRIFYPGGKLGQDYIECV